MSRLNGAFIALDPASTTGWAALSSSGGISSGTWFLGDSKVDQVDRCFRLRKNLLKLIEEQGGAESVRWVFYEKNSISRGNLLLPFMFAMIEFVCHSRRIPIQWVSPEDAKEAATGKRSATKLDMVNAAKARWDGFTCAPLRENGKKGGDEADARWILVAAMKRMGLHEECP